MAARASSPVAALSTPSTTAWSDGIRTSMLSPPPGRRSAPIHAVNATGAAATMASSSACNWARSGEPGAYPSTGSLRG